MAREKVADTDVNETGDADPLKKVADAMSTAALAIKEGAVDAKAKVSKFMPVASRVVSKTVYASCYYASYGVVFPSLVVASVVPKNNILVYGLNDGAKAAKDAVQSLRERRSAMKELSENAKRGAAAVTA